MVWTDGKIKAKMINKQEEADLDNNQTAESYWLEKNRLSVWENSKMVWRSPDEWRIDNFILADANNDGVKDINLSLWKAGNFGPSKPFWIKENDMEVKNHFLVLDYEKGGIKQVWGSSNLGQPNCEFQMADIDDDGKIELIVIEGNYGQQSKCRGDYVAVWKWDDWGFSNKWRSDKGDFDNLIIENIDQQNRIVVDSKNGSDNSKF